MVDAGQGKIDFLKPVWKNIKISPGQLQLGPGNNPNLTTWQPGGGGATLDFFEYDTGDETFFVIEIPLDYCQGTDMEFEIHWTPRTRGAAEDTKTVFWKVDYSFQDSVTKVFPSTTTVAMTGTCDGVNDKSLGSTHGIITGTNLLIGRVMIGRFYRDAGDTWVTNTVNNRPLPTQIEIYYQADTLGSQTTGTKTNKNG